MCTQCENIQQDFERCIEELSNNYDPKYAAEAADWGNILMTIKELKICRDKKFTKIDVVKFQNHKNDTFDELINFIEDELHDVEKYYNKYIETKELHYIKISKDELSHFQWFLSKLKLMVLSADEQNSLSYYLEQYNIWLPKLS